MPGPLTDAENAALNAAIAAEEAGEPYDESALPTPERLKEAIDAEMAETLEDLEFASKVLQSPRYENKPRVWSLLPYLQDLAETVRGLLTKRDTDT